ncbi:hypothetical protein ABPG72_005087 [Tetrahymena utriculariae]
MQEQKPEIQDAQQHFEGERKEKKKFDFNFDKSPFLEYYKFIGLVSDQNKDQFISSVDSTLPITFRLNKNISNKELIDKLISEQYPLFKRIQWLTSEYAYQLNADKLEIRKNPEVKKYQTFLQDQDCLGKISRQELVSMIPAALIDAQPNEKILDMCAAPGSKTKQMLESMMKGNESLLFANDISKKRAFMLAFHVLKLNATCAVLTSNDCTKYPKIEQFDKVLCDVPCSGDGTIRKQKLILKRWSSKLGKNLHCLQLSLLLRALYLVKKGGSVVYSTCSLNPMENESVVSAALHILKPYVKIIDVKDKFPGFKFSPTLFKWPVVQKKITNAYWSYESIDDVYGLKGKKIFDTMFPQEDVTGCLRITPHMNDTGGFFVAYLQKTEDFDESLILKEIERLQQYYNTEEGTQALKELQDAESENKEAENKQDKNEKDNKKEDIYEFKLEKLIPLKSQNEIFEQLIDFYGFQKEDEIFNQLYFIPIDNQGLSKNILLISSAIRKLITEKPDLLPQLSIVNCGLKVFTKVKDVNHPIKYRIIQEGLNIFFDKIAHQKIELETYEEYSWMINNLPKRFDELDQKLKEKIDQLKVGIIAVTYKGIKESAFTVWKGINILSILLDKEEKKLANFSIDNKLF